MRTKCSDAFLIPSPRLNQFQILQNIAINPDLTQAELARRCALSVAMVNNYMKELCRIGLLQYRRKSSKNVSYHLTAEGEREVEINERELTQEMMAVFEKCKERFRDRMLSQYRGLPRRVVLFGNGNLAQVAYLALDSANISVIGICNDDPAHIGRDWCGRKVLDPSHIPYMDPDAVVIADSEREDVIYERLSSLQDYGIHLIRLSCGSGVKSQAVSPAGQDGGDRTVSWDMADLSHS